ncbi:hypothetical protein FQN55_004380 [Onygenales sp. PD_40]|nr:hypothetical protein FQN55_004380 [Onygenales sp. PD_40]KAK2788964.1 hypothetical protein FQN53_002778 [Emmonsiellopsis sp. PD_33]KAK2796142.1 hypothetical protein FQN52_000118 [Onygenales sp. PD_12]KAK2804017.1 hypothetical protein FQN51_002546 [Onygenales sp. PD_10]
MPPSGEALPRISDSDSDRFSIISDDDVIITNAPEEPFRLGRFDVAFLVVNRMIGTGIFSSAGLVIQGTRSIGVTLIFWFFGILYSLGGVHLYIEYGLNIPRRRIFEGVKQGVPRSGGDLNYLQYVYKKPSYRKDTVLLSVCTFGVVFIIFGNVAGNCLNFAEKALRASNAEPTNGAVRGIAIAVALFTCFIHTLSRRGGIVLSNFLAIIKLAILLLIIIAAIVAGAGGFPNTQSQASVNFDTHNSFRNASTHANDYANAFLLIIFTFSGFEQPNYVLGEIAKPRQTFPMSMAIPVAIVGVLYMAVNVSYMSIVPWHDQINSDINIAERFFKLTFGSLLPPDNNTSNRILNAFLAISSFGNIVVMTYTAARVKQEIAKEGILPYPKFFAKNRDMSLGRLLRWAQRKPAVYKPFRRILKSSWFAPEHHSEKTPVGALLLHFASCLVLMVATVKVDPSNAYALLSSVYTYAVHASFGALLSAGILYLRFSKRQQWRKKTPGINPFLSVSAAFIYFLGSIFPVVVSWVKPTKGFETASKTSVAWYMVPMLSWCAFAFGALWWLGFLAIAKRIEKNNGTVFTIEREPSFERDPPNVVQVNETVYLAWVAKENLPDEMDDSGSDNGDNGNGNGMNDFDFPMGRMR